MTHNRTPRDALLAGMLAAGASGLPSTAWTVLRGRDGLEGARAAGKLLLPREERPGVLLAAAVPVHLSLSLGWAVVLAALLPRAREPLWGAVAGLAIAALDLGLIGRHIPAIRSLEQPAQWADHVAFGATVGVVLRVRRSANPTGPMTQRPRARPWQRPSRHRHTA